MTHGGPSIARFPALTRVVPFVALVVASTALAACAGDADTGDGSDGTGPTTDTVTTETVAATPSSTATAPPATVSPPASTGSGTQPEGFTTVQARITDADGEVCEVCLWLADAAAERGRGLMGVTDLGDAVGMAFRFEEPTSGSFYMFQTPTPLSIAWFAPDGGYVGSADMQPCLDQAAGECPLYSPDGQYDVAIEVFEGGLEPLGLGVGSRVELIEGSEAERCPSAPQP
jgi:uncharacterized membrane protein (UPF0127 family)